MYFTIKLNQGPATLVYEAELSALFHHTSASEAAQHPVLSVFILTGQTDPVYDKELFEEFKNEYVTGMWGQEMHFKLPPARGKFCWGCWLSSQAETNYPAPENKPQQCTDKDENLDDATDVHHKW